MKKILTMTLIISTLSMTSLAAEDDLQRETSRSRNAIYSRIDNLDRRISTIGIVGISAASLAAMVATGCGIASLLAHNQRTELERQLRRAF